MQLRDKIKGSLYGFAVGDSMGATTEFMAPEEIKKKYGIVNNIIGGGWLNLRIGDVTDDTQMSMCIMNAIMNASTVEDCKMQIIKNFVEWYNGKPKDVGNQCAKGIENLKQNRLIEKDQHALGNGSLMRALPFALVGNSKLNVWQGNLTHNNCICESYILEYTDVIRCLLKEEIPTSALRFDKMNATGCIINTFNNAAYYLTKSKTFEEAIIGAVNDGGDADTIAAITGSLVGMRFGYNAIPIKWKRRLNANVRYILDIFADYIINNKNQMILI